VKRDYENLKTLKGVTFESNSKAKMQLAKLHKLES
jgi:hypothetical protein